MKLEREKLVEAMAESIMQSDEKVSVLSVRSSADLYRNRANAALDALIDALPEVPQIEVISKFVNVKTPLNCSDFYRKLKEMKR